MGNKILFFLTEQGPVNVASNPLFLHHSRLQKTKLNSFSSIRLPPLPFIQSWVIKLNIGLQRINNLSTSHLITEIPPTRPSNCYMIHSEKKKTNDINSCSLHLFTVAMEPAVPVKCRQPVTTTFAASASPTIPKWQVWYLPLSTHLYRMSFKCIQLDVYFL